MANLSEIDAGINGIREFLKEWPEDFEQYKEYSQELQKWLDEADKWLQELDEKSEEDRCDEIRLLILALNGKLVELQDTNFIL